MGEKKRKKTKKKCLRRDGVNGFRSSSLFPGQNVSALDWFDLEVETDEREDETLEILDQVVECAEALGILGVVHIHQRADLRSRERNVLVAAHDLQFL